MPKGAQVLLSAGCAGNWYFDWIEKEYGHVERHIGIELYTPGPANLPQNVEWVASSVSDMTAVSDGSVDLVFSGQNLEHLFGDDLVNFMLESWRVIKPSGHLVIDSPNRSITTQVTWCHPEHTAELTPAEAQELVTLAGFDVTSVRGIWLVQDQKSGRLMEWDPYRKLTLGTTIRRRIEMADRDPSGSFIWWLEAKRSQRVPDVETLTKRHAQIFEVAWRDRVQRLSNAVGQVIIDKGTPVVRVNAGQSGYAIAGPYAPLAPGDYSVNYQVRRTTGHAKSEEEVLWLDAIGNDATSEESTPVIASRPFTATELPVGEWTTAGLAFSLTHLRWAGQFRVWSTGLDSLEVRREVSLEDRDSLVWPSRLRAHTLRQAPT